jgi:flagellar motility protein MotE (MotC chaperone)
LGGDSEDVCLIFASPTDEIEPTIICQSQAFAVWKRFMKEINDVTLACIVEFRSKQREIKDFRELLETATSSTLTTQEEERQKNQDNLGSLESELDQIQDKNRELQEYLNRMEEVRVSFECNVDYSVYIQSHIF